MGRAVSEPFALALLARCEGLIDEENAEHHFTRAVNLAPALSPFDQARSELLYGEWLRRQRRRADAPTRDRTCGARSSRFERMRATPWEARARAELRASGESCP